MRKRSPSENQLAVLKAIRAAGPVARSDLPQMTGLAAGTISQITAELVRRGFVVEKRESGKRPGRPRMFLEIAGEGPVVLGASITMHDTLLTTFVDLSGRVHFELEVRFPSRDTLKDLAVTIAEALSHAIEASGYSKGQIEHVGIGMPALVDSAHGIVHFMSTFEQAPVPFASLVSGHIELPVTIEKNITSMARAEHWSGHAQAYDTFTLLHIGLAIDSAMYMDGLPQTGAHGIAPEMGHIKTDHAPSAEPCYCGAHGCATAYASVLAIVRRAGLLDSLPTLERDIENCEQHFRRLLEKACAGDAEALELFECAGTHLGRLVADHINSADPGNIIILVPDSRFATLLEKTFNETLQRNTVPGMRSLTKIEFSELSEEWQSMGTAALALEKS